MKAIRAALAGVAAIAMTYSAMAQTTWGGLHFGMAKVDVQDSLKAKGMLLGPSGSGTDLYVLAPEYALSIADLKEPIPFTVSLALPNDHLQRVELRLDADKWVKTVGGVYAATSVVNDSVRKALTAKYGPSIAHNGTCDSDQNDLVKLMVENDTVSCKETWHGQEQTIQVSWFYFKSAGGLAYFLSYQPASADL